MNRAAPIRFLPQVGAVVSRCSAGVALPMIDSVPLQPLLIRHGDQAYPTRCQQDTDLLNRLRKVLSRLLPRSTTCTHLAGNGGLKGAGRQVQAALSAHRYAFRTDVKSYYASIDHHKLMDQLAPYVHDRAALNLLWQYMRRHQEKLTRLYEQYQRHLRAFRKRLIGQTPMPRPEKDPARAYLYPRPHITSQEDIRQRLEVYKRRFTAWASGGLASCEIG